MPRLFKEIKELEIAVLDDCSMVLVDPEKKEQLATLINFNDYGIFIQPVDIYALKSKGYRIPPWLTEKGIICHI